jgi:protein PhnA
MNEITCPMCSMNEVLKHSERLECVTCGHEWGPTLEPTFEGAAERVVKDANGNVLSDGDSVTLLKDLKLKGSTQVIKGGTKVKSIRLVDGDHEISCKIEGSAIGLKACFVKKA